MPRSMTGFGRASTPLGGAELVAEIKTVNNRYLKTGIRLPDALSSFEPLIEAELRSEFRRGTVNVVLRREFSDGTASGFRLNTHQIEQYAAALAHIAQRRGHEAQVDLASLAQLPGVIETADVIHESPEQIEAALRAVLAKAIAACVAMRKAEGAAIVRDLEAHCASLLGFTGGMRTRVPQVIVEYRNKLRERIATLLEGTGAALRDEDLARECAFFADRCDISEEIQRLDHHCASMRSALAAGGEIGRKLDFVAQEMLREANTMGSKSADAELVGMVIEMKSAIEKIKEQVQNIE